MMTELRVVRHKRGWAVVEVVTSGYYLNTKTVIKICKTKKEAQEACK